MSRQNTLYLQFLTAKHITQGLRSEGYAVVAVHELSSIEVTDPDTGESWLLETKVFEAGE